MKQPHQYTKRILLAVTGKTPQIVTETLYKLAVDSQPAFVPTEIHLITTSEGEKSAKIALLGLKNGPGEFHRLCDDYNLGEIIFNENTIHVISDTEGQFLSDDQSTRHNRIASDFITAEVRELTADRDSAIHLSLAGGRKTMSFYAGYALSLYGRMQDRLSHVLVNEPFQNSPDFFYPPPEPTRFSIDNTWYSTSDAVIILSDIPYVRMRYQIPESLLNGKAGFQESVALIQRFAQPETIEVDLASQELKLNGLKIPMSNADLAFYLWFCKRRQSEMPPLSLQNDTFMQGYLLSYSLITSEYSGMYERAETIAAGEDPVSRRKWFLQRKSKVKKCIEEVLGTRISLPFLIQTVESNEGNAYEIVLDPEAITIRSTNEGISS